MSNIKKVGIAADKYKLDKFKEELDANGFTDYEIVKGITKDTSTIMVKTPEDTVVELKELCERVQFYFANRN